MERDNTYADDLPALPKADLKKAIHGPLHRAGMARTLDGMAPASHGRLIGAGSLC